MSVATLHYTSVSYIHSIPTHQLFSSNVHGQQHYYSKTRLAVVPGNIMPMYYTVLQRKSVRSFPDPSRSANRRWLRCWRVDVVVTGYRSFVFTDDVTVGWLVYFDGTCHVLYPVLSSLASACRNRTWLLWRLNRRPSVASDTNKSLFISFITAGIHIGEWSVWLLT